MWECCLQSYFKCFQQWLQSCRNRWQAGVGSQPKEHANGHIAPTTYRSRIGLHYILFWASDIPAHLILAFSSRWVLLSPRFIDKEREAWWSRGKWVVEMGFEPRRSSSSPARHHHILRPHSRPFHPSAEVPGVPSRASAFPQSPHPILISAGGMKGFLAQGFMFKYSWYLI